MTFKGQAKYHYWRYSFRGVEKRDFYNRIVWQENNLTPITLGDIFLDNAEHLYLHVRPSYFNPTDVRGIYKYSQDLDQLWFHNYTNVETYYTPRNITFGPEGIFYYDQPYEHEFEEFWAIDASYGKIVRVNTDGTSEDLLYAHSPDPVNASRSSVYDMAVDFQGNLLIGLKEWEETPESDRLWLRKYNGDNGNLIWELDLGLRENRDGTQSPRIPYTVTDIKTDTSGDIYFREFTDGNRFWVVKSNGVFEETWVQPFTGDYTARSYTIDSNRDIILTALWHKLMKLTRHGDLIWDMGLSDVHSALPFTDQANCIYLRYYDRPSPKLFPDGSFISEYRAAHVTPALSNETVPSMVYHKRTSAPLGIQPCNVYVNQDGVAVPANVHINE